MIARPAVRAAQTASTANAGEIPGTLVECSLLLLSFLHRRFHTALETALVCQVLLGICTSVNRTLTRLMFLLCFTISPVAHVVNLTTDPWQPLA